MNIAATKLADASVGHLLLEPSDEDDGDSLVSAIQHSAPSVGNLDNQNNVISSARAVNNDTNVKGTTINVSDHQDRWGDNLVLAITNSPGID